MNKSTLDVSSSPVTTQERVEKQESLLHLYLRLNGYFVSSFIVHSSEPGKNITQVDALAVRHPFNREPRRQVGPSAFLAPQDTDVLVCEVNSRGQQLQFNERFRDSDEAIDAVVAWTGVFNEAETLKVVPQLKALLQPSVNQQNAKAGVQQRGVTIRPLLCCPEQENRHGTEPWFLFGEEIFSYIGRCLNPQLIREGCSTTYGPGQWGAAPAPIVRYFKQRPPDNPGRMQDLYKYLLSCANATETDDHS